MELTNPALEHAAKELLVFRKLVVLEGEDMRGIDHQQSLLFSYLSPETRVRKDHPLRAIRVMVDEVLMQLSRGRSALKSV
jgi:hypothetical protein